MGCFDYTCAKCKGKKCGHYGHQFCSANVVIEVPIRNNKTIHLQGFYEEYGYVLVKGVNGETYTFYLEEFEEHFKHWITDEDEASRAKIFIANCAYTYGNKFDEPSDDDYDDYCYTGQINEFTPDLISECIRVDGKISVLSDREKYRKKLIELRNEIVYLNKQYNQVLQKLK